MSIATDLVGRRLLVLGGSAGIGRGSSWLLLELEQRSRLWGVTRAS